MYYTTRMQRLIIRMNDSDDIYLATILNWYFVSFVESSVIFPQSSAEFSAACTKREFTGHRICLCREREGCMKHYQSAVLSLDITEACCMVCATCQRNGNIRDLFHKGFETMFTSKTTDRQKNHSFSWIFFCNF